MEPVVSLILIILAATCNAVMDICSHKFNSSVFSKLNPWWWNAEISWKNKYINRNPSEGRKKLFWKINYPVQLTDAWHFFKMLMLVLICLAVVFYRPVFNWWADILYFGTAWNCTFSLFYSKVFVK